MENLTNTAVHLLEDSQGADLTRREKRKLSVEITTAMIALVCLVTGLLYKGIFPEQTAVAGLIYSVGVLVEGLPLLATAIRGFLQRDVTNAMEILVSIAVLACYITGQHELAILIPVVLSVVHFLEERSIMGGRDAIEGLKQMQATDAVLETEDGEVTVEVQALKRGDIIIVRPGMGLPIDGTVIWGNSNIDQKSLTGEPLPAAVTVGDTVYAGTTNLDGMIKVRVEKEYQDTSFTKIVSLLEEAQSITVPEIRIVDRFMHYYIPLALIVAALTALLSRNISNAIAVLDLASRTFDGIYSAGFEDYSVTPIDIDKKDDAYAPRTYGSLMGIRMPDGIAAFQVDGKTYLVTANEGDAREWGDEDLGTFYLSEDEQDFGEEGVTSPTGAITGENSGLEGKVVFFKVEDFDGLDSGKDYLFGGRTFTIYEAGENGVTEVFTSGNDFETLTARYLTDYYNCSNDNTVVDDRSGKKGPEAESVTVGTVDGRTYAFVALERTGGVMVYDVTEPASAQYVNYINTRDFASVVEGSEEYEDGELDKWVTGGDVAPEGLLFLDASVSPTGEALLLAACEVSGTVAVYQVGGEPLSVLPFTDVEARDAQAVRYVCENGLMAGVSADRFEPNGTLTRGEAVTALWALEGRPVVNYLMDFSDVDPAASYGEAVRWAASEGIAGGYGGGLFGPDDPITREQLAVMLYRYARHEGYDTAQGGMAVREFADYDQIAGYAAEAMTWAVEAGVLTATSLDTLAPGQAATRVQTAQALLALSQIAE